MPVAVLLFLLLCRGAQADDISLSRVTENWRYFKGINEPSSVPKGWTGVGYDDSQWLESLASVSTPFIYGETTQLPDYGYGYRSIYFRRNFIVSDISGIAQLTLRIDYDDGFVAYLNGKEIVRRGVSGGADQPVAYDVYATYHPRGFTEEIDISGAVTNLLAGTNVLAIQLQGWSTNDFTACMVAELMANFSRAPYVQNTTTNSTYIVWKTLSAAPSFIEFGTNTA